MTKLTEAALQFFFCRYDTKQDQIALLHEYFGTHETKTTISNLNYSVIGYIYSEVTLDDLCEFLYDPLLFSSQGEYEGDGLLYNREIHFFAGIFWEEVSEISKQIEQNKMEYNEYIQFILNEVIAQKLYEIHCNK